MSAGLRLKFSLGAGHAAIRISEFQEEAGVPQKSLGLESRHRDPPSLRVRRWRVQAQVGQAHPSAQEGARPGETKAAVGVSPQSGLLRKPPVFAQLTWGCGEDHLR